jgi:hypothetical protein
MLTYLMVQNMTSKGKNRSRVVIAPPSLRDDPCHGNDALSLEEQPQGKICIFLIQFLFLIVMIILLIDAY